MAAISAAALPPLSAERLCLSAPACLILRGYASNSEVQPQLGMSKPLRTHHRWELRLCLRAGGIAS